MKKIAVAVAVAVAMALLALPLAAEQKNVKLLKGMTDLQLQRTMNFMRASLGVACDYCHVLSDDGKWDFAADTKKEKETARKMITLTMDLNAKYFDGHTDVSCNSCHRGSTRPVGQPVLPQAQPPMPTPKVERPPLPSRDEIVAKYAAAIGKVDEKALEDLAMKASVEMGDGRSVPIEFAQHEGTYRVVFPNRTQTFTATAGTMHDDKGDHPINPSMIENLNQLADAYRFILPKDIAPDARVRRKDKIGDREVYIVRSGRTSFYFDAQNGLLLRRITYTPSPIGDVPMQTDYSDYREVGGMKLPFTVRVDSVDPWIGTTRKYSEIKVGAKAE